MFVLLLFRSPAAVEVKYDFRLGLFDISLMYQLVVHFELIVNFIADLLWFLRDLDKVELTLHAVLFSSLLVRVDMAVVEAVAF